MSKIPVRHIKDSFFEERFSIREIKPLVLNGGLIHELHRHDFHFVLFIKKGKGFHQIDFIDYTIKNYSVFFIRPGQVHQLQLSTGTTGFMLQFTPDFYSPKDNPAMQVLRKVSTKNYCQLSPKGTDPIFTILQSIFREYTLKDQRYIEAIQSYLAILFINLARQSDNPYTVRNENKLYAQERLEELQTLLDKNIYIKKKVSDYAALLNMTTYQLNAITKSLLQKTGSDIINEHIILEAKRLLIATNNQVNQVADMLGYDDHSYFIRFFKKQTGLTPEVFRQNFK